MTAKTTLDIVRAAAIKPPAKDYLPLAQGPQHYAQLLLENNLWMAGIAYLSHAITPRENIWWGWYCARKAAQPKSDPAELAALAAVEAWIAQPTDEKRLSAWKLAEKTPAGAARSILEAVYWTGETENEATGEKIPAVPEVSNKFVQGAVLTAVYALNATQPEAVATEFLRQGMEVANRINLWANYR
jgi:hypothetical protein